MSFQYFFLYFDATTNQIDKSVRIDKGKFHVNYEKLNSQLLRFVYGFDLRNRITEVLDYKV